MNALLFGATGMIGQGVLRECLHDPAVKQVVTLVRRPTGQHHEKLREIVRADVSDLSGLDQQLNTVDACFFCLGVSSAGMSEQRYTAVTYDLTIKVARALVEVNPNITFSYISGASTDSTEKGRMMWARVKGRTENALLAMPFKGVYMFRPGAILPLHGIRSATPWYNAIYVVLRPLYPTVKAVAPNSVSTTEQLGRAMINVAHNGYPRPILELSDINSL